MKAPVNMAKIALVAIGLAIVSEPASAACTCRARDVVANEGEVVCLNTPLGQRLARCDKVLNNTSWTFLREGCPTASQSLTPAEQTLADLRDPLPADSGRGLRVLLEK